MKKFNGSGAVWWGRSPRGVISTGFCRVDSSGNATYFYASYAYGVAFGFCF